MNIENIASKVRTLAQQKDSLTNPNECRNSVILLGTILKKEFPTAEINFLVYPEAKRGDGVHYALSAVIDNNELLINLVSAPGYPEFVGDRKNAIPIFSTLKKTPKVI